MSVFTLPIIDKGLVSTIEQPKQRQTKLILSSRNLLPHQKSNYTVELDDPIKNVVKAEFAAYDVPWPVYNIDSSNNRLRYIMSESDDFTNPADLREVDIPPGNYTPDTLSSVLALILTDMNVIFDNVSQKLIFTYKPVADTTKVPNILAIKKVGDGVGNTANKTLGFLCETESCLIWKNMSFTKNTSATTPQTITFQDALPLGSPLKGASVIIGTAAGSKYYTVTNVDGKTITLDRDLDADIEDGFIVFGMASTYPCRLAQRKHINLFISEFEQHDAANISNQEFGEPFAIIYRDKCTHTQKIYEKNFTRAMIKTLNRLHVSFKDDNGVLVDFQDKDHVVEILVTYETM